MKMDIYNYGTYRFGLTNKEINEYLRERAEGTKFSKWSTKKLHNEFNKIAGPGNTMGMEIINGKLVPLMYRLDVERFANVLFDGTPTYFD